MYRRHDCHLQHVQILDGDADTFGPCLRGRLQRQVASSFLDCPQVRNQCPAIALSSHRGCFSKEFFLPRFMILAFAKQ
jgi:hypothetical protein